MPYRVRSGPAQCTPGTERSPRPSEDTLDLYITGTLDYRLAVTEGITDRWLKEIRMNANGGDDGREVAGRALEEAVDIVAATRPVDRDQARALLAEVARDGSVTWSGVESQLEQSTQAVETTVSEFEDTQEAFETARELAAPVSDLDIVEDRFEGYETRFEQLEARVEDLQETLGALEAQYADRGDLFELARQLDTLLDGADRTRRSASELAEDIESIRDWLGTPQTRYAQLEADLASLETAIEDLAGVIRDIEPPGDRSAGQEPVADSQDTADPGDGDPAVVWFDARLQHLVFDLLVADVRVEYEGLVEYADRVDEAPPPPVALGDRIDSLSARCADLDEELAALASEEWRERFGDQLERFEGGLAPLEPPVDWPTVQSALENVRPGGG